MSRSTDQLRLRREALLRRIESERQRFGTHVMQIEEVIGGVDRGLGLVRRLATRPVVLAAGIVVTLLLGRRRTGRLLASGMALLGLVLRVRSMGRIFSKARAGRSSPAQLVSWFR